MVVDNRAGAASIIGTEMIARSAPDGYTLGYVAFSFSTNPSLYAKLPYDTARDFQLVVAMLYSVNLLAVSPSLPMRTVKNSSSTHVQTPTSCPTAIPAAAPRLP